MNLTQKLKSQLAEYETDEFFIDEHARERCRDYHNLDLDDVLQRLKQGKFSKVVKKRLKERFSDPV